MIGGLASSLLLTLVLVPVVYVALAAEPRKLRRDVRRDGLEAPPAEPSLFDAPVR